MLTGALRIIMIMLFSLGLGGCMTISPTTHHDEPAAIGGGVQLFFARRPEFPENVQLTQLVSTTRDGQTLRVQGDLVLGPQAVDVAFSVLGGPQVMAIHWSEAGLNVSGSDAVPRGLTGRRVLADIVLAHWPTAYLQQHLSVGAVIAESGGRRTVSVGGAVIVEITTGKSAGRTEITLVNHAQGYEMTIISK